MIDNLHGRPFLCNSAVKL